MGFCLRYGADAEFHVANLRVRAMFPQGGEDLFFLKREFLDDDGVGDSNFEDAAFKATRKCVRGECFAGGVSPGFREIGGGLDASVAAGGDQLGQDVFDGFGAAGVVPALLAVATEGEVGGRSGRGIHPEDRK